MEKHQYSDMESHLKAYQAECERDPLLKQFDLGLQQRTGRIIQTLNEDVNTSGDRSLSLKSVKEITDCFVKTNVDVADYILKFKEDVLRDDDLYDIVKDYFDNSLLILKVCTALKECIDRARDSHLFIKVALGKFETEQRESGLNLLEKFKAAGNPFTEEFSSLLKCVYQNQESMLQNLKEKKSKLDEKLNNVSTWWTVSNVLFGVAAFSLLICFAVAAIYVAPVILGAMWASAAQLGMVGISVASLVPPVVPVTAVATVAGVGATGVWINYLWKKHEDELKAQREIISTSFEFCFIGKNELGEIESGVDDLKKKMESVLGNVDFALQEDAVRQTMDTIKTKLNGFMESMEELSKHAAKCEHDVKDGMAKILDKIIKYRN